MYQRTHLALGFAALFAAACGSSNTNSDTATMNVQLVDAPADYTAVTLDIQKVEISTDGGQWLTLGTPNKTINLLSLTNGVVETLANGASLPPGTYGQMRLLLGPNNTVTLASDPSNPQMLKVPSGMQSGLKLPVSFDVQPGTTKDVFIDFDAHRSIFVHGAGASGQYLLRPVVRVLDKVVTGSIGGALKDGSGNALAGQTVLAEIVDGTGNASIVTSAITSSTGAYTLGLLPLGGTYYVVAQPFLVPTSGPATVYAPASAGTMLTASASVATVDVTTGAPVAQYGGITATVSDSSSGEPGHTILVSQSITAGIGSKTLIIRTQDAAGTPEVAAIGYLPVATSYIVSGLRTVANSDGTTTVTPSTATTPASPTAVTNGTNTAVTVAF